MDMQVNDLFMAIWTKRFHGLSNPDLAVVASPALASVPDHCGSPRSEVTMPYALSPSPEQRCIDFIGRALQLGRIEEPFGVWRGNDVEVMVGMTWR